MRHATASRGRSTAALGCPQGQNHRLRTIHRQDRCWFRVPCRSEDVAYSQRGSLPVVILLVRLSDAPLFWKRHRPMALRTTSKLPCIDYAIFGLDEMTRILEGR